MLVRRGYVFAPRSMRVGGPQRALTTAEREELRE
jgi:hypothetical protein